MHPMYRTRPARPGAAATPCVGDAQIGALRT